MKLKLSVIRQHLLVKHSSNTTFKVFVETESEVIDVWPVGFCVGVKSLWSRKMQPTHHLWKNVQEQLTMSHRNQQ